jgi:hypothetical protein
MMLIAIKNLTEKPKDFGGTPKKARETWALPFILWLSLN